MNLLKNTGQMKKILIIYLSVLVTAFSSCLDVDPVNQYSEDDIWASVKNLDANVKGFYASVLNNTMVCELRTRSGLSEGYTDLVKFTRYSDDPFNRFFAEPNYMREETAGTFSPYTEMYNRIAMSNYFLIQINEGKANHLDQEEIKKRVGEVRFLRAFAYQELVKRHGGVILRIDEHKLDGVAEQTKARSTADECWDFIIGEYRKAVDLLPASWGAADLGRLTKGSAWGMMARAAIYAGRWDIAIEAAKEVLALGIYSLQDNYGSIYTTPYNNEILIGVYFDQSKGFQHAYDVSYAPSGEKAQYVGGLASPTDEFACNFDIKVGDQWKAFDWNDVINNNINPWANRDPRFYETILYNGAEWKGRNLELYVDGKDGFIQYAETGLGAVNKSVTGYAFRKFLTTKVIDYGLTQSDQYWIEMRLSEIYLILSEAYARKGDFDTAYEHLNYIRTTRSSVKLPKLDKKPEWNSYLIDLQKERICELGLEGHRFWDIRRWGISNTVLNGQRTHGIKITKNANNTFKYERVECDVRDRLFPEKYNVVPIPYAEISSNTLCVQDDIWK